MELALIESRHLAVSERTAAAADAARSVEAAIAETGRLNDELSACFGANGRGGELHAQLLEALQKSSLEEQRRKRGAACAAVAAEAAEACLSEPLAPAATPEAAAARVHEAASAAGANFDAQVAAALEELKRAERSLSDGYKYYEGEAAVHSLALRIAQRLRRVAASLPPLLCQRS